jgi:hypothetical protein
MSITHNVLPCQKMEADSFQIGALLGWCDHRGCAIKIKVKAPGNSRWRQLYGVSDDRARAKFSETTPIMLSFGML